MIRVRVPATTANMGPGFDCFGMALKIYNEFEFYSITPEEFDPSLKENLIYKSMVHVLKKYKYNCYNFGVRVTESSVPMSRGLGSSATCIVAGIIAANDILGNILTQKDIIDLASEMEGHPDNVTPAIVGGMVVSLLSEKNIVYSKIPMSENIKFAVMVPNFEMSTEESRKALPNSYSKSDVVFNVSRAAMMIANMYNENLDNFRECFKDKIHQPFRKKLIPNIEEIFDKSKELGSIGEFISGSGSTLIAVIKKNDTVFEDNMREFLSHFDVTWNIQVVDIDLEGAKIL